MPELLRLSVSKTKVYLHCAAQFKYNYILKLPKKEAPHLIFGTVIHEILELFHMEYLKGSTEPYNTTMTKIYKNVIQKYTDKLEPEARQEAYELIKEYLKKVSTNKSWVKNVTAVEKDFNFSIENALTLNGKIDRVQMDDDGLIHVADYKTTKNIKYLKNDFFQLATYCLVLHNEDPSLTKFRASYILLRHQFKMITKEFDIQDILRTKEEYIKYAEQINNETEYKENPGVLCGWCDYLDNCTEGKKFLGRNFEVGETHW